MIFKELKLRGQHSLFIGSMPDESLIERLKLCQNRMEYKIMLRNS